MRPLGFDQLPPSYEEFILKPTAPIKVKPSREESPSEQQTNFVEIPMPIPYVAGEADDMNVPPEYSSLKRDRTRVQGFSYNMN